MTGAAQTIDLTPPSLAERSEYAEPAPITFAALDTYLRDLVSHVPVEHRESILTQRAARCILASFALTDLGFDLSALASDDLAAALFDRAIDRICDTLYLEEAVTIPLHIVVAQSLLRPERLLSCVTTPSAPSVWGDPPVSSYWGDSCAVSERGALNALSVLNGGNS